MVVDMSPEAVTERLRLMDELWELSMKLKESKKLDASEMNDRWQRLEAWFGANWPDIIPDLNPPCDSAEFEVIERDVGIDYREVSRNST